MRFLLLLAMFSLPVWGAYENPSEAFDLTPEELDPSDSDVAVKRKERYQWDESLIRPMNSELGIRDTQRFTGRDRNKLAAAIHVNGQYERLQKLQSLELTWLRRSNSWHKLWWGATYRLTTSQWDEISSNSQLATTPTADADQTINTLGLGLGYRFKLFLDFFPTEDVFETIQAYATYNTLAEGFTRDNYAGYGMSADYGVHKRTRTSFFYGGKFTYNIAWMRGPTDDDTLSLGWYTFALEMGFFF